jgi:hypothetical protein
MAVRHPRCRAELLAPTPATATTNDDGTASDAVAVADDPGQAVGADPLVASSRGINALFGCVRREMPGCAEPALRIVVLVMAYVAAEGDAGRVDTAVAKAGRYGAAVTPTSRPVTPSVDLYYAVRQLDTPTKPPLNPKPLSETLYQ